MKTISLKILPVACAVALAGLFAFGCGQVASGGKEAGHACVLSGVGCSALPQRVCAVGRGSYQPYTCKSIGYKYGPCSRDSYGGIFAKTEANCQRIKVLRGG